MTLEQLRIFVAVAACEHVTKAARDLNLTQSATSAAIAALEARYATRLFDRIGRRIVLTEGGRLFAAEAKAVLARANAAETVLADLAGLNRGTLILGASQTVANYWLPPVIHRFKSRYPGIMMEVIIGNTETVSTMVREGVAGLGFIEGEIDDPFLSLTAVADDELILVVAPGHPWASQSPLLPDDLKKSRWVFRESGSGTRGVCEIALSNLGVALKDLEIDFELPSNEAVRAAVEAGAGAAVMSKLVAGSALKAGSLINIDIALPRRQFFAVRHRERYVTQAEREFCSLVSEITEDRDGTLSE